MFLVRFIQFYSNNKTDETFSGYESKSDALTQLIHLGHCSNVRDIKLFKVDELHEVPFDVC